MNDPLRITVFLIADWAWLVAVIGGAVLGVFVSRGWVATGRTVRPAWAGVAALLVGGLMTILGATAVQAEGRTNWERHPGAHGLSYLAAGATVIALAGLLTGITVVRSDGRVARPALALGFLWTALAALLQFLAFLGQLDLNTG